MNDSLRRLLAAAEHQLGAPPPVYPLPDSEGGLIGQFPMWHPLSSLYQLSTTSVAQGQAVSCQTDPIIVSQIQVKARLQGVQRDAACQTDPAGTVQVGAGGGTSSGDVGECSDPRGRDWKKKVEDEEYTNPSKWNKYWANRRKEEEEKFLAHFAAKGQKVELPWEGGVSPANTGNKCKVLYFWLLHLHERGVVDLGKTHPTQGFFGITRIGVTKAMRSVFDAGDFPSASSTGPHYNKKYKEMSRTWQIAGFRETVDNESGDLKYEYDAKLQKKVRVQFTDTRLRQMARYAKEREEKAGV
jgi:hypothetical protein